MIAFLGGLTLGGWGLLQYLQSQQSMCPACHFLRVPKGGLLTLPHGRIATVKSPADSRIHSCLMGPKWEFVTCQTLTGPKTGDVMEYHIGYLQSCWFTDSKNTKTSFSPCGPRISVSVQTCAPLQVLDMDFHMCHKPVQ